MPQDARGNYSSRPSPEEGMARQLREINRKLDLLLKEHGIAEDGVKYQKPTSKSDDMQYQVTAVRGKSKTPKITD